ncbi:MAG TPA: M20/M25/M40 family metallo-hydrolase [Patescibacteria group bacterium]|nr:M20/M25/M40 family metallo-hydrolase [Patescibacteria group bacterium]
MNKILSLAKELIAIPSISGNHTQATAVLEVAKQQLQNLPSESFITNNFPSILYSNHEKNMRKFKIILNAHLDVVPAPKAQFNPIEKNGKLYGRGAFDMKAAAAVEILVFKELANKLSYPLGLQLTTDEEPTGEYGTGYQIEEGVRANFIIIGECNSNLQVTNESKGRKIVKISIKGKSSHSAYPWLGENVIYKMQRIINKITKAFPEVKEETKETTVSITQIIINHQTDNKIPDNCTIYLDIRESPKDDQSVINHIKNLLSEDVTIEINDKREFHFVKPDNPYITKLRQITEAITGINRSLRFTHATSDAPFFSAVGCAAIEFGPIGNGAHHDNEWVDIKSLETYYHILKRFLLELDTIKKI